MIKLFKKSGGAIVKRFLRRFSCAALAVVMVLSLSACGTSNTAKNTKGEKTKLTFALWDENQKPVFDQIIQKFESANPDISVDVQLTPWADYWTKLDAAMGAGNAADVFWMNTYLPKYADAGVVEPLDQYIQKDKVNLDDYVSVITKLYNYKGKQYGMPVGMDTVQVFYNKAIFAKYGVTEPKDGWTWDDMVKIGGQLRDKIKQSKGSEYPVVMELDAQPSYFNFIKQDGGYVISDDGKTSGFNLPGTVKAYQDVLDLMKSNIMPSYKVLSDTKGTDIFLSQKAAILFMGTWQAVTLDNSSFASNIGTIQMPKMADNNESVVAGLGYAMNAKCKNKDAAWRLIKYLAGEESNKMQAEAKIDIPALISAQQYYSPNFKHLDPNVFFKVAQTGYPFPTSSSVGDWLTVVSDTSAKIFSGQVTPQQGCQQIYTSMQKSLDSEGSK